MWPRRKTQERSISISDPVLAEYFGIGNRSYAGVAVNEMSALGISAFWRAGCLISQTIASLPMRTLRDVDGRRDQVSSFLDDPGGPEGPTRFEWVEQSLWHAFLHGNIYWAHVFNGGGGLAALAPIHPLAVSPEWETDANGEATGRKTFTVTLEDGTTRVFTSGVDMTQVMGPSLDGLRGLSVIGVARNSLGTAIAGDRAAAKMFGNGPMIAGLVTPDEDITEAEGRVIKEGLTGKISGVENAGDIALVNRKLTFTPWSMTNEDAQFLESREFSIEEVSRWTGVPAFELGQSSKQTSWGTGIEARQRGMGRTVLAPWTTRLEQRLTRLLPKNQFEEFDFAGLERPTPEAEIGLLIQQVEAGLLTSAEARHIRNMEPLEEAGADPAVAAALDLARAAPSLVQSPGLPALVDQLRALSSGETVEPELDPEEGAA